MHKKRRTFRKKKKRSCFSILFILLLIVFSYFGVKLYKKYSYTTEKVDLNKYIGVSGNDVAIYLNDEKAQIQQDSNNNQVGIFRYNNVYLPLSYINDYINPVFYYDEETKKLLYSLSKETLIFSIDDTFENIAPVYFIDREVYVLIDFVKKYSAIRFSSYTSEDNKRIFIYTTWENEQVAYIRASENARVTGGNKGLIICPVLKGEEVSILTKYDKWSLVRTNTGYIGYIRNSKMDTSRTKMNINNFTYEKFDNIKFGKKISLCWHQVANKIPRRNFEPIINEIKNTYNIIAPTWFIFDDDFGTIKNNATTEYSEFARDAGLSVWATVTNINEKKINIKTILSKSSTRAKIIKQLIEYAKQYSCEGINIDIEDIPASAGDDFIQFIREFSIACRLNQIISSVCLNIPYEFNRHYHTDEIGKICDYVCLMCYNEFHMASTTAGPNSSLTFVNEGINKSLEIMERDKLIIGLPLYTYVWFKNKDVSVTARTLSAENSIDYAEKNNLTKTWDEKTGSYYCTGTVNKNEIEVWLEEIESLSLKLDAVNNSKCAGFAFWKISQDNEEIRNLIKLKY